MSRRPDPAIDDAALALVGAARRCSPIGDVETAMTQIVASATYAEIDPGEVSGAEGADVLCALYGTTPWADASRDWQTLEHTPLGQRWRAVRRLALRRL